MKRKPIVPADGARPAGPYSPGLLVGDYLYLSGQGVRDAEGKIPEGLAAQADRCLKNVKAIVEAAGLTLEHIVHLQLYLEKISDLGPVDRVYAGYFGQAPPARVVIGVARMPGETNVEMTALAIRDLSLKKTINLSSLRPAGHASSAVEAGGRVFLSGVYGQDRSEANDNLMRALAELGLDQSRVVFRNDYGTDISAMIPVSALPGEKAACLSAIASRADPPDGIVFCNLESETTAANVEDQLTAVMQKLQARLESHGASLSETVAVNVYLDDMAEFKLMNEKYATFFPTPPPTRTTVQPFPKADRTGANPPLVCISLIAVKRGSEQ